MRLSYVLPCSLLAISALAWDQFDYSIFDLVSEVETSEGKGASFYSFLNVTASATTAEIAKQYRKRSLELHPDKNPDDKNAQERFARLGTISQILRDEEQRARYDYFYKAGVPKWRGTGYYYARYRPGIALVVLSLALASCGIQYLVQRMNFILSKQRLDTLRRRAVRQAYGENGKAKTDRRLRVRLPKSELQEDRHHSFLFAVHGDDVYLIDEETKEEHLLDDSKIPAAAFSKTWLPSLILSLVPFGGSSRALSDNGDVSPIEIEPPVQEPSIEASAVSTAPAASATAAKKRKNGKQR